MRSRKLSSSAEFRAGNILLNGAVVNGLINNRLFFSQIQLDRI